MLEKVSKNQIQWRGLEKMDELRKKKDSTLESEQGKMRALQKKNLELDYYIERLLVLNRDDGLGLYCAVDDIVKVIGGDDVSSDATATANANDNTDANADADGDSAVQMDTDDKEEKTKPSKCTIVIRAPADSTMAIPLSSPDKPHRILVTNQSAVAEPVESKSRKRSRMTTLLSMSNTNMTYDKKHPEDDADEVGTIHPIDVMFFNSAYDAESKSYKMKKGPKRITPMSVMLDAIARGVERDGGACGSQIGDSSDWYPKFDDQGVSDFF